MAEIEQLSAEVLASFDPDALRADLGGIGLSVVEPLSPADIQARYVAGRRDGYRALEHTHIVAAVLRVEPRSRPSSATHRAAIKQGIHSTSSLAGAAPG